MIGKYFLRPVTLMSGISAVGTSGAGAVGDLDAHRFASTSSRTMRSFSASERWHAEAWCPSDGSSAGTSLSHGLEPVRAPRMERAARRHVDQRRRQPLDRDQAVLRHRPEPRDGTQQAPRVRVVGLVVDVVGVAEFDGLAGVHHLDVVAVLGHDAEVVRDDDDGGVELVLQPVDQVEDLRLHRHVERGRGLVGDQQVGVQRQAPWRSSPAAACRRRTRAGTASRARRAAGC